VGAESFSLRHLVRAYSVAHLATYPVGAGASFPGRGADHSPPSGAEVRNVWSSKSNPTILLHGVVVS
jgi:hypothetical protein